MKKLKRLIDTGKYDANIARYIPGTLELAYQGRLDDIKTMEQVANPSYKDLETFDFQLLLDKNLYTNLNSVHFFFPIKLKKKKSDVNGDIGTDLITVNNFFAHWIKEISITKYGTNKELTATTTLQEIYQYSDGMLQHLPAKSLKVIENDLLYSKEKVVIPYNLDRRFHGMVKDANNRVIHNVVRSDGNFRDREAKFRNQLKDEHVYRILLKYICDIGKINFPTKIEMKIRLTLETDMKKQFESDKNHMGNPKSGKTADSTNPNDNEPDETPQTPDVQIVKKSPEFANKSDQHSSINTLKFDIGNDLQKHLLWKQYLAWCTNGCSTAPVTDFMNNPIAQELKKENEYFSDKFDERLYVDLRPSHGYTEELEKPTRNDSKMTITIETKTPLVKKMRLRVWGYTSGEYIYLQHDRSLT